MWKKTVAVVLAAIGLCTAAGPASTQTPVTETYTYDASGELIGVERTGPPPPLQRQSAAAGAATNLIEVAPGSTITTANASGSGNVGRMQFNGQMWLPDMGVYHYKARTYHPGLGRFMQTDPVGYAEGMNLYAYVGNDPINRADPTGMFSCETVSTCRTYWREGGLLPSPQQAVRNGNHLWPYVRNNLADLALLRAGVRPTAAPSSASQAASVRRIPNPYGSRGGPAHQERVAQRIRQLEDEGMTHVGGGSQTEEVVRMPNQPGRSRRPDITMDRPDGSRYRENVGRQNRNGQPVARERRAQRDIEQATGQCAFTPYNNC